MRLIFLLLGFFIITSLFSQVVNEREYYYAFTEATKQYLFGNDELAERQFIELSDIEPVPAAYYQRFLIHFSRNNFQQSLTYLKKAENLDSLNIFYKKKLISLYEMLGQRDSLLSVYERIIRIDGYQDIDHSLLFCQLLFYHDYYDRVVYHTERIQQQYGFLKDFTLLRLQALSQLDSIDQAIDEISLLLQTYPDKLDYYLDLAGFYQQNHQIDSAFHVLQRAHVIFPENPTIVLSLASHNRLQRNLSKAYEYYDRYLDLDQVTQSSRYSLLYTLYQNDTIREQEESYLSLLIQHFSNQYRSDITAIGLAIEYHLLIDQINLASDYLKQAIRLDSSNYMYWEQLFYIQYELALYDSLYCYTDSAISLFSDKRDVYVLHAIASYQLEYFQEALSSLKYSLSLPSGDDQTLSSQYILIADCYRELDEHKQSDKYYEKAMALDPDNNVLKNNYAYYLSQREDRLDYAYRLSRSTLRSDCRNPYFLDTYAWILFQQNKIRRARFYIKRAIRYMDHNKPSAEVYHHYGDIVLEFRDIDTALIYWKKSYLIDDDPLLYKKIKSYDPSFNQ